MGGVGASTEGSGRVQRELALPPPEEGASTDRVTPHDGPGRSRTRRAAARRGRARVPAAVVRWVARTVGLGSSAQDPGDPQSHGQPHGSSGQVPVLRTDPDHGDGSDVPWPTRCCRDSRAALIAAATGPGHRRAAEHVGLPATTVRGWLRRARANSEAVRVAATVRAHALDPMAHAFEPTGNALGDMTDAIGRAISEHTVRLGAVAPPWHLAVAPIGRLLLAPARGRA